MEYYKYFAREGVNEYYPELINVLEEYIDYIDLLGKTVEYDYLKDGFTQYFKISALNALAELFISNKRLLEFSHWRAACILTRTLFEFLINIEYIFLKPEKSEELCAKFFKFGKFQQSLHVKKDIQNNQYNIHNKIDPKYFMIDDMIKETESFFKEFIKKKKSDGTILWYSYWNIKSPREMVKELNNPDRIKQYNSYYSNLSDYVHGSPIFVSSGIYLPEQIDNNEIDEIENNHVFKQVNDLLLFSNDILRIIGNISPEFQETNLDRFIQKIKELAVKNDIKGISSDITLSEKKQDQDINNILPDVIINTIFDLDFSKPTKEGKLIFMKKHKFKEKVSLRFKKNENIVFHEVQEVIFKMTRSGFIHCTVIGQDHPIGEIMKLPPKIIIKEQIIKFSFDEIKEYIIE